MPGIGCSFVLRDSWWGEKDTQPIGNVNLLSEIDVAAIVGTRCSVAPELIDNRP